MQRFPIAALALAWVAYPATAHALDARPEHVHAVDDERPPSEPCDLSRPAGTSTESCRTPRDGTLSGGYLALDIGLLELSRELEQRVGVGPGAVIQLRLGFEFWDHVIASLNFGGLLPADQRRVSESVVDCTTINGVVVGCDDDPHQQSSIVSGTFLAFEVGAQQRFRPWQSLSLSPGVMTGFSGTLGTLSRGVDCDGCHDTTLDAKTGGMYLAPFFRVTFGKVGELAAILRSQWFLSGEVVHMTSLGFECGLP